jgi:hypothetical protein
MACCNEQRTGLAQLAHGAVGSIKALVGIDRAPDSVIAARVQVCRQCDRATRHRDGVRVLRCLECTCWIKPKTRLAGEKCPLGRWNNVP